MEQYKNADGSYTSPKNGKIYKSEKALRAHLSFRRTEKSYNFSQFNKVKEPCEHCGKLLSKQNLHKHEETCYLNPAMMVLCKVCNKPIKNYKTSKGTCSHGCANTHFKRGVNNGNWKGEHYTAICFIHHQKKCVVCGEEKIVAVHHYDHNHNNNDPTNLVPLCPTHHQYLHSRYADDIKSTVDKYVEQFKLSV